MNVNYNSVFPRVNGALMSKYLGRGVILLGEVSSFAGDDHTIILKTSDGTNVRVSLPPGEQLSGKYVEVVGKVIRSDWLEAQRVQFADMPIDFATYNKALELMHGKYNYLFE